MGTVTLPNSLTNGTTADATQVMADLNAIVNQINGNLDTNNLASGAVTSSDLAASEAYREVGASGQPAFQNGWTHFDTTTYGPIGFYKDLLGVVHLRGTVKNGTANFAIFTLPVGYRPGRNSDFAIKAGGGTGLIRIGAVDGLVSPISTADTSAVALDGITFRAEN